MKSDDAARDAGPDWVRDGVRQFVDEVRSFARTTIDFALHPTTFARQWASGERHALNPLGFLATALAVVGSSDALFDALVHRVDDESQSFARSVAGAVAPFIYYVSLGAIAHLVLRLFGSRRPWRDSCAMALYAGGGLASLASLLLIAFAYALYLATGQVNPAGGAGMWFLLSGAGPTFLLYCGTLAAALAGVHAVRRWQGGLAVLVAVVVAAFGFGAIRPPGRYGLHPVLVFAHRANGKGWRLNVELSD